VGAARRHSRTPVGLMQDEAVLMVQAADADPVLREAAEVFTGREWSTMTTGEKVNALLQRDAVSRAAGAVAGGMRGMRDLKNEVNLARYGVTQDDKLLMMESQIAELTTRQERLAEDNAKLKAENAELRAEPARVVHSSEAA
jgi:hypothetical protein